MKISHILPVLVATGVLAACGSASGSNTVPTVNPENQAGGGALHVSSISPSPAVSAAVSPGHTAVPTSSPSASAAPTATPLALATGYPVGINAAANDSSDNGADIAYFPESVANTAPHSSQAYNEIDGLPALYNIPAAPTGPVNVRHWHTHLSVLDAAGKRMVIPIGIGMIGAPTDPLRSFTGIPLTVASAGGTWGTYYVHTHDHSGMLHVEDDVVFDAAHGVPQNNAPTLGTMLALMGDQANSAQFTHYVAGNIHVYLSQIYVVNPANANDATTEVQTTPVEWKGNPLSVPAIPADDFAAIPLLPFEEITVETTSTYVPVPHYYFPAYWCEANQSTQQPDCRLNAAPAGVKTATAYRKPDAFTVGVNPDE